MANTKKIMAGAAAVLMLAGCANDTRGVSAVYDGDGWSVRTDTGTLVLSLEDDGRGDWGVSGASAGIEVESNDPAEYTIRISKTGDGSITLAREIARDNAPYLQTMTVRYTADSDKNLYNVDVTTDAANIVIANTRDPAASEETKKEK